MLSKMQEIKEKGNRDQNQEMMEKKIREVYQMKKSEAITKFEIVLSKMVNNSIKQSTLETLHQVKRPIFNKQYD